jgi:hypothetical protein
VVRFQRSFVKTLQRQVHFTQKTAGGLNCFARKVKDLWNEIAGYDLAAARS